jgi:uncharacterized membrane protein YoaK (UPF0700 family)
MYFFNTQLKHFSPIKYFILLTQKGADRTFKSNILLASSTAFAAGMTNVSGVLACYTFTSNVTGHTAAFAKQMLQRNWEEMWVVFSWVLLFLLGAFFSHFLIRTFERRNQYFAHALPLAIECIILFFAGLYGLFFYTESGSGTYLLTASLLFSMGMQNSAVSVISGGSIKVTHLTGLFTDLGAELSEWIHPAATRTEALKQKLLLRFTILGCYLLGGFVGGWLYLKVEFFSFFAISLVLLSIILYDYSKSLVKRIASKETKP